MCWGTSCASSDAAAPWSYGGGRISTENTLDVWNIEWIMLNSMIELIQC